MNRARIPTIVIGGWLGAGKTTLVNHLLRHAGGRRIAVLVNDFGEVGIDADLVEGRLASEVLALAGGCICCAIGADLVRTLERAASHARAPDVVLIECSGVAQPRAVARSARLAQAIHVDGIVTLFDAEQLPARLADGYVGDTARAQLAEADLLIANKADLADPARLRASVAAAAPDVPVVQAVHARVDPDLVLGVQPAAAARPFTAFTATAPAASRYASALHTWDGPVDVPALARALAAPQAGVLRAKGVLDGTDGRRWVLQAVGRRVETLPAGEGGAPGSCLVTIRLRADGDDGLELIAAAAQPQGD